MLVEERYRRIRTLLKSHGTVSVEHMTQALGVSRERRFAATLSNSRRRAKSGACMAAPCSWRASCRSACERAFA